MKIATLFYKVVAPSCKTPRNLIAPSYSKKKCPKILRKFYPPQKFILPSVIEPLLVCTKTVIIRDLLAFFIGPPSIKKSFSKYPSCTQDPTSYILFFGCFYGDINANLLDFYTSLYKKFGVSMLFSA